MKIYGGKQNKLDYILEKNLEDSNDFDLKTELNYLEEKKYIYLKRLLEQASESKFEKLAELEDAAKFDIYNFEDLASKLIPCAVKKLGNTTDKIKIEKLEKELDSESKQHELCSEQRGFMRDTLDHIRHLLKYNSDSKEIRKLTKAELAKLVEGISNAMTECYADL